MEQLLGLVGFSFVSAITPGPNNLLLWASGTSFGIRRTLRHVLGTALGLGAMALGVSAGLGALVTTVPEIAVAMKLAGSVYLLWLAWQVARAGALEGADVAHPLGLVGAAALQLLNPKAWIFALGAITTFRPAELPLLVGSVVVAAVMMAVIVPSALLWAAAGGAIGKALADDRARRVVGIVLAVLLAVSVVTVWL